MRSDGEIDKADFMKRKTEAEFKLLELQNKIAELEADGDIPDSVVEAFVEKIVVSKDGYDWYLRFDGDPGDPLH